MKRVESAIYTDIENEVAVWTMLSMILPLLMWALNNNVYSPLTYYTLPLMLFLLIGGGGLIMIAWAISSLVFVLIQTLAVSSKQRVIRCSIIYILLVILNLLYLNSATELGLQFQGSKLVNAAEVYNQMISVTILVLIVIYLFYSSKRLARLINFITYTWLILYAFPFFGEFI